MEYKYINDALNEIYKLTDSYAEWDNAYGLLIFEFYPNGIISSELYLEKNGSYDNAMADNDFAHEILQISGFIHKEISLDDTFSKLPEQLYFKINHKSKKFEYHFVYDIADKPNYSSFNETLYFEYHLMGLIPEDIFHRELLNKVLSYHGEKPLD